MTFDNVLMSLFVIGAMCLIINATLGDTVHGRVVSEGILPEWMQALFGLAFALCAISICFMVIGDSIAGLFSLILDLLG